MPLLTTVPPEKADGKTKEVYSMFEQMGIEVPKPLQMLSASPEFLAIQGNYVKWVMQHPNLSPELRTYIRLMTAQEEGFNYCIDLNSGILKGAFGLSDEEISAAGSDISKTALKPEEQALLKFVQKVMRDPALTEASDVDKLKSMGWKEQDILDATVMATNLLAMGMMFKAFQMGDTETV